MVRMQQKRFEGQKMDDESEFMFFAFLAAQCIVESIASLKIGCNNRITSQYDGRLAEKEQGVVEIGSYEGK
jgi:hypothetical protein